MTLLSVRDLTKTYPAAHGRRVQALSGVSLQITAGEVLGVVGESGCGKSTLGRAILRLAEADSGEIVFDGQDLRRLSRSQMNAVRRDLQVVFQDPFGALNPRHKVGHILAEPLIVQGIPNREARVAEVLGLVGLPDSAAERYPHEFSGGQRQRIAIARALAVQPRLIVCDEPTSALDVSVQAQILNLLRELQRELGVSYLFITHNIGVVEYIADRVAVMQAGRIEEQGPADEVLGAPASAYTRNLLAAVPRLPKADRPRD
jgi:ABC-type oligopeptide transport system ATPase subunit